MLTKYITWDTVHGHNACPAVMMSAYDLKRTLKSIFNLVLAAKDIQWSETCWQVHKIIFWFRYMRKPSNGP